MAVGVDEARHDDRAGGVDRLSIGVEVGGDGDNRPVLDQQVRPAHDPERRVEADDRAAPDQQPCGHDPRSRGAAAGPVVGRSR